jgi:hypothetical protein
MFKIARTFAAAIAIASAANAADPPGRLIDAPEDYTYGCTSAEAKHVALRDLQDRRLAALGAGPLPPINSICEGRKRMAASKTIWRWAASVAWRPAKASGRSTASTQTRQRGLTYAPTSSAKEQASRSTDRPVTCRRPHRDR